HHRIRAHRVVRAAGVERAGGAALDHADRPLGQVARVDHLHRSGAVARHKHLAALGDAVRPVGEAVALVARADDVARAGDAGALAELTARFGLAQGLERAVEVLDVGHQGLAALGLRYSAAIWGEVRSLS